MENTQVRTRIAPSPTGYPHIGTIYQALFNFAFAKKNRGQFVLRIEDTDRARLVEDATDAKKRLDEPHVIRLKIPDTEKITVNDEIRGRIEFDPHLIEDAVLIKSDGYPTYHFAVVVDDPLMERT